MNYRDARKVIQELSQKTFVCNEHYIETDSGYIITTKEKQARAKKQTNGDMLRSMTDNELAEWLYYHFENYVFITEDEVLNWLKKKRKVEVDKGGKRNISRK